MMRKSDAPATVFVDADNTLWDTDTVFAHAQLALLNDVVSALGMSVPPVDALAFIRAVDQALAERHHAGLRYPPRLLIRATELALAGMPADAAARTAWKGNCQYHIDDDAVVAIEQRFFSALAVPSEPRPGVVEGLKTLHAEDCLLLVISEGSKAKIDRNAERLGIARLFNRVLEVRKSPEVYRRVLRLTGVPGRAYMIGDQLDRDIAPAKIAGIGTIYFPGGFQPRWSPAVEKISPDHIISSFAQVPHIVLGERNGIAAS
jgi:putative hydrolase of the HAD superfamily